MTAKHVALVPDGNRRWAVEKGLSAWKGHEKAGSYLNVRALVQEARNLGIKYFSLWGFSTENWKRKKKEREVIFNMILELIARCRKEAQENKVRFLHIGRKDRLPKELLGNLEKLESETREYKDLNILVCLDYGGRDEIVRAINRAIKNSTEIDEKSFSKYLDTEGIPDPDLIIRTGGEKRLSGFMPFQSVYSELYFTDVHFPDFGPEDLRGAMKEYGRRVRRLGK